MTIEISKSKIQREKRLKKKKEQTIQKPWDDYKRCLAYKYWEYRRIRTGERNRCNIFSNNDRIFSHWHQTETTALGNWEQQAGEKCPKYYNQAYHIQISKKSKI